MQPSVIYKNRVFVRPVNPNEDSEILIPNSAEEEFPNWYRITRKGEDVSDEHSIGDIVLMSPQVVKRQGLVFEFTDDREEIMMKESNILGKSSD